MKEYSYAEHHMGTTVSLSFVCPDQATAEAMAQFAITVIKDYEQRFSRFLPTSELSLLNQNGKGFVSTEFLAVLQQSLKLAELTEGNFNPLMQVKTLGYTDTYPQLKSTVIDQQNILYSTDLSQCHIDTQTSQVVLGLDQQLDLGGILKGYLANKLADNLMEMYSACLGCIINIGGDLATRGEDELHQPFIFNLYNPVTGTELPVTIKDKSLATSGTYARQWKTNTLTYNHIIDSRTRLNPTTGIVAVSVIAEDGALTEALTKLFLTRGVDKAIALVPPHKYNYQYFIVSQTGETLSTII